MSVMFSDAEGINACLVSALDLRQKIADPLGRVEAVVGDRVRGIDDGTVDTNLHARWGKCCSLLLNLYAPKRHHDDQKRGCYDGFSFNA